MRKILKLFLEQQVMYGELNKMVVIWINSKIVGFLTVYWSSFLSEVIGVCMCANACLRLEGFIYLFHFLFFSAFHIENKKRPFGLEGKTPSSILICLTQSPYCIYFPEAFFLPFFFLINTYKTILLEVAIQLKYLWKSYLPWVPVLRCSSVHFFPAFFFLVLYFPHPIIFSIFVGKENHLEGYIQLHLSCS